jgi:hypothetical protein
MMTTRVSSLWDRPPVRWAFTTVALVVLGIGAVVYWNSRDPNLKIANPPPAGNPYQSGTPASYGPKIPFPHAVKSELQRFVKDGILRQNPAATYDMVSPKVRAGMSRSQWATGTIPIPEFPNKYFGGAGIKVLHSRAHDIMAQVAVASTSANTVTSLNTLIELKPVGKRWVIVYAAEYGGGPAVPSAQ